MIKDKLDQLGLGAAQIIGLGTAFLFITGVSYYYGYYVVGLKADWLINLLTTKELLISNIRLGAGFILALMFLQEIFFFRFKTERQTASYFLDWMWCFNYDLNFINLERYSGVATSPVLSHWFVGIIWLNVL